MKKEDKKEKSKWLTASKVIAFWMPGATTDIGTVSRLSFALSPALEASS